MRLKNFLIVKFFILINFTITQISFGDNHNIYETLELIQKDIKTLEKAVYSGSLELNSDNTNSSSPSSVDNSSEDRTVTIAKKYTDKVVNVTEFYPGKAINEGIRYSTGKYIVILSKQ